MTDMGNSTVGTPEYCHANFPSVRIFHSDCAFCSTHFWISKVEGVFVAYYPSVVVNLLLHIWRSKL
jgi:hypothetical protein